MIATQVFTSGNSQAVRIPKEYHIDNSELFIKKIGTTLILYPQNRPWENLKRSLSEFTDDFMAEGRSQPKLETREEIRG
ncbi:MAG: AbrB/MazE/SpoVT family DNA-binding domain-containing protein [Spirochaetaceae bacterium]|nr:AbrB/MazE/SpoVT family DNA-binding domain-containing protein [Spirochaetaceae bacterium]